MTHGFMEVDNAHFRSNIIVLHQANYKLMLLYSNLQQTMVLACVQWCRRTSHTSNIHPWMTLDGDRRMAEYTTSYQRPSSASVVHQSTALVNSRRNPPSTTAVRWRTPGGGVC